ncbi:hypothetical protein GT347_25000 [Xylophilus rhododendri]|uniref:NHL repeat containing protein n=1 Tax=Xylophilus rhododendri TaxID=2697032 RepID=A0A857JDV5_9BURK|nr:hypothetical protein [Xylophilus rhododendri]QHJ00959.1 hypothetical protein GT347_25000 [Xylophilus rhododendri]
MNIRLILASLTVAAVSACGGSGNSTQVTAPGLTADTVTGDVSIVLSFPVGTAPTAQSAIQLVAQASAPPPSYISAKTQSVSIVLTRVNGVAPATPVGVTVDVKAGSACVLNGANLDCTVTLAAPVGNDEFDVNTWPSTGATGNMPISSGTGTATVAVNTKASLDVTLLPRVNTFAVDISPGPGVQPIATAGVFTARIRAKDSAGDIITGATPYHDAIVVTDKDILTGHITASPSLPATFASPATDTLSFTYDGAGTAASYGFDVKSGFSQTVYLTLAGNVEHLYVSQRSANRIDVFDIQDDGSLTGPSRSIVGASTGLDYPASIAVDSLGQLYVANRRSLAIFAPGAGGNATPLQTSTGGDSNYPVYISDKAGMIVNFVADSSGSTQGSYTVSINYPAGVQFATDPNLPPGGIPPFKVGSTRAVASYSNGTNGYVCATSNDTADPNQSRVRCFTQPISWATGLGGLSTDYPNIQIFNGSANFTWQCCRLDASDLKFMPNGALIVSSYAKYQKAAALETYSVGQDQVLTSIQGPSTGIDSPGTIAVDSKGRLYVFNYGLSGGSGAVLQFAGDATGDQRPLHSIGGFNNLGGIAVGK